MSSSIDSLAALIPSVPLAALTASVAAVILSVFCALLAWRQQRCLAAMQTQLDNLRSAIRSLERDYERLFIRSLNLRRSRKAQKSSSPSPDRLEEMTVRYLVAPKTSPE